ncbi:MAG: hypothetical protein RIR16_78 [Actinomycetota bacterium]
MTEKNHYDVVLIGAGIMSATLGTFLKLLKPDLSIRIYERLSEPALESSNPWNNAGTGHAALCELNYMPDSKDGSLPDPGKAVAINEQFQLSRQFWSYLVEKGVLGAPESFIHSTPHMTFVRGAKDVDYLNRRFKALKDLPLFRGMEFSEDPAVIAKWAPLLIEGRVDNEPIAATKIDSGTDVDFGSITRQLLEFLVSKGVETSYNSEVKRIRRDGNRWRLSTGSISVSADVVFVGAGGWALKLLQKSGIDEAKGYGTFPVSGKFYRTDNPEIVAKHQAKVYSQASVGAPPMSVPHLDTRVVDGEASLLFGPYAGAIPKFLKKGSIFDLPASIRPANIIPYLSVAISNFSLVQYLIREVLKTKSGKLAALREFMPTAEAKDWYLITAGQRAQVIKKDAKRGGILQFGTEVVSSADGSIAGLLGASPGASTAVHIMLEVLKKSFSDDWENFQPQLKKMLPSYGVALNKDAELSQMLLAKTAKTLKLKG